MIRRAWRREKIWLVGLVLVVLLPPHLARAQTYTVGDTVQDFALRELDGRYRRLYSYQNKVVLLNFFVTW